MQMVLMPNELDNLDELRRIAAKMYAMVVESHDIFECLEPTGDDAACPPCDCSDCGWYRSRLRDDLLRLGVPI